MIMPRSNRVTLSVDDFTKAILHFMCRMKGGRLVFFPMKIVASSVRINQKIIRIDLSRDPVETVMPAVDRELSTERTRYTLTKNEILHALSFWVCIFIWKKPYDGNHVLSLTITLPETIHIETEFLPRGATSEEAKSLWDGSLQ